MFALFRQKQVFSVSEKVWRLRTCRGAALGHEVLKIDIPQKSTNITNITDLSCKIKHLAKRTLKKTAEHYEHSQISMTYRFFWPPT